MATEPVKTANPRTPAVQTEPLSTPAVIDGYTEQGSAAVDTYVTVQRQTATASTPARPARGNWFTNLISRMFTRTPRIPDNYHTGYNGWIPLSDIVAFFETVKTHNLNRIRQHYGEIAANGFDRRQIYDVLMRQFNVAPAQLEHDIGHQNPNPNRSITELTSNAVDAMNGRHRGNVNVTIRDGSYIVEDSGSGMSAEEVFEKLLIPQLSGKSGEVTIGRFGIGFYTALVHLRNQNSRVIVDTKREGQDAIRFEFIRLNGELGVRVGRSDRTSHGTTVTVVDDAIGQDVMNQELASNMGYVLNRTIMVNGRPINALDSSRVRTVGNGRLYVSEETGLQGRVVITVGGVKIEEFETTGHPVPSLMVFDLPLSTKLPESRNQIRVDRGVVNQVRAFIDAVNDIEGYGNKIAYLNGLAPMITELQRRNEDVARSSDIAEYARFVAGRYLHGRKLMPDDPVYDVAAREDVIRVNDLYLGRNWHERFHSVPEWRGQNRMVLADFAAVAGSGIIYDALRNIIILDRSLYETHKNDPAGLEVLVSHLPLHIQNEWNWSSVQEAEGVQVAQLQDASKIETVRPADNAAINTEPAPLSPLLDRVTERHPILVAQLEALKDLEMRDPEAVRLIAEMPSVYIPYIGFGTPSGVYIIKTKADRLFGVRDMDHDKGYYVVRLARADGTPAIEGQFLSLAAAGKDAEFIIAKGLDDSLSQLLKLDGSPAFEAKFRFMLAAKTSDNHFIAVDGPSGLFWQLLKTDGTPAIEGEFVTIDLLGKNYQFIKVQGPDQLYRLFKSDGTPAIEGSFDYVEVMGKDDQFFEVRGSDGLYRLFNSDGTPAIEGEYDKASVKGRHEQFLEVWRSDGLVQLFKSDGTVVIEGKFEGLKVLGNDDQIIAVMDSNHRWRLFKSDGTPAIEGEFIDVTALGNARQFIAVMAADRRWRLFNSDGTPAIEEKFRYAGTLQGRSDEFIALQRLDKGWQLFKSDGTLVMSSQSEMSPLTRVMAASAQFLIENHFSKLVILRPDGTEVVGEADRLKIVEYNERDGIFTLFDGNSQRLMESFDVRNLSSARVRSNLERLIHSNLEAFPKQVALSLLSFPEDLFDFALAILPHTKMDMRYAQNLLEILQPLAAKYSPEIVGLLCDVALSLGWGDAPPQNALAKLEILSGHLSRADLSSFRDILAQSPEVRDSLRSGRWDRLTVLPPKLRAYAYYLGMDSEGLLLQGSTQIPAVTGSGTFSLVDLNTAVRSHRGEWREFNGSAANASRLIRRQTAMTDPEVSTNRIRHAMYHLGDGQNLLFIRELIQNSLDAIRNNGGGGGEVNVESFEEDGAHVLRITDPVGMSLTDALNNLFIFGESTKGEADLGKFGVGFFTIYPGAKEIRIKTGTGDGKVAIFTLRPVYDGETVVDITMSYVVRDENFKGTIIERISNSEIPALDAAIARSSVLSYGRFLDAEEIGVEHNGRQVNQAMRPIADQDVPGIGRVRIFEASENAFTVGGLYVKNIPPNFYETLPPAIREIVVPTGIVIDLPGSTAVVRSRNDFVDPAAFEGRLMPAAHAMLVENYLSQFARGEVDISGIPEVYFNSLYGFAEERRIPREIREDAEQVRNGEGLQHIEKYLDDRKFLQLLTLLPCLNVGEERISMFELLERVEKGEEIDQSRLPRSIKVRLGQAMESVNIQSRNKDMMGRVAQELGISESGRELALDDWKEDRLHRHWKRADAFRQEASSYDAFLSVADRLMGMAGSRGHTVGLSSFLERNALADHAVDFLGRIKMYFSLTAAERYASELAEILSADQYPAERMQRFMAGLIDDVTHEMTHDLLEGSDEWTHDPEFYRRQQQIVTQLLRSGPLELEKLWRDLKARYPNPTFMPEDEFLKLLVTGRSENPSGASPAAAPSATPAPVPQAPPVPSAPPAPANNGAASAAAYEEITRLPGPEWQDEEWESVDDEYEPGEDPSTADISAALYTGTFETMEPAVW